MKNKLIGFATGLAVGVGAGVAVKQYFSSEKGKKMTDVAQKTFEDFKTYIKPRLKMVKEMNEAKYKQIVTLAAGEYGIVKKLSGEKIEDLICKTLKMWDNFTEVGEPI